jgi:hypothetical protein
MKMKRIAKLLTILLMSVCHTSSGQIQTSQPQDNTRVGYSEAQLKEAETTKVPMGINK